MPTDERLRTDDRDGLQDRRKPSIQLNEEQAIVVREPDAAAGVNKEVAHWLDDNSVDTLLIAITDGELGWEESIGDFGWREGMPLPRSGRISG